MRGGNVKITILQRLLQSIAPDLCYLCGKIGASLCHSCKYGITYDAVLVCFRCGTPASFGVCGAHAGSISLVAVGGAYTGGLKKALHGFKFQNDRYVAAVLAGVLCARLPRIPHDVAVVPIPTLAKNRRRRGYDHALLLAKHVAGHTGGAVRPLLRRVGSFVQHTAEDRVQREASVKGVFQVKEGVPPESVLLVDDIITTGSTLQEAASVLKRAGVKHIYAAAVAYKM